MKNHSPHTGAHPQISASFHFCFSHPWWSCGTQKEGRRADAQWHCHKLTVLIASSAATSPHSFITAHLSALVIVSLLLSPFTLGEPREPAASLVQAQELRGRAKILPFHLLIPAGRLCSDHSPGHATPLLVLVPLSNRTPPPDGSMELWMQEECCVRSMSPFLTEVTQLQSSFLQGLGGVAQSYTRQRTGHKS